MKRSKRPEVDKMSWTYGVVVNRETGEAYTFNRDYLALEARPDNLTVERFIRESDYSKVGRAFGMGRFRPEIGDESPWTTYWFPEDKMPLFFNSTYDQAYFR